MAKIIGLAGKVGSGKSFIGDHLKSEAGIKIIKLDYYVAEVVNTPILKQLLQRRIKNKIPEAYADIQLFPLWKNLERDFTAFENFLVLMLLNRKLKKVVKKARKTNESLIIDFVALPALKAARKFDETYLVKSDEEMRIKRLAKRDGLTEENARRVDKFLHRYYKKYDVCSFNGVLMNDYERVPEEIYEIAARIK